MARHGLSKTLRLSVRNRGLCKIESSRGVFFFHEVKP